MYFFFQIKTDLDEEFDVSKEMNKISNKTGFLFYLWAGSCYVTRIICDKLKSYFWTALKTLSYDKVEWFGLNVMMQQWAMLLGNVKTKQLSNLKLFCLLFSSHTIQITSIWPLVPKYWFMLWYELKCFQKCFLIFVWNI